MLGLRRQRRLPHPTSHGRCRQLRTLLHVACCACYTVTSRYSERAATETLQLGS